MLLIFKSRSTKFSNIMASVEDEIEELQLQMEEILLTQKIEVISELAKGLGIGEVEWKNKRKIQVINVLRKYTEGKWWKRRNRLKKK